MIQEIEQPPENVVLQLLDFLHLLQFQPQLSSSVTETDESLLNCIDGFMVIKAQGSLPDIDWVSFVREERINDLTSQ
ncbi:hypothetical protein IQ227_04045 [Anabaena aphanizomenioides LEGE 00250]|uniref:Uncharacterized protein n=1 Tax=Sphaerospermopsis aphanizomenoides LEGE 00250 TaxID=2777972 RepID=A0ABR9V9U6_9CYAN|nr:hypothetical protein [Sphaerospermopsis aphanizomenoides]MBE9235234.1 hypothetical protein [Sphaerospermopsis aphanizomenoides LEGE 00250]